MAIVPSSELEARTWSSKGFLKLKVSQFSRGERIAMVEDLPVSV